MRRESIPRSSSPCVGRRATISRPPTLRVTVSAFASIWVRLLPVPVDDQAILVPERVGERGRRALAELPAVELADAVLDPALRRAGDREARLVGLRRRGPALRRVIVHVAARAV